MASVEDIGAATRNISEDSDTGMGGSGSKSKEDRIRVSGLGGNGDVGSGSGGGEPACEAEIAVQSTIDCVNEKEKIGIENIGYTTGSSSGIDGEEGLIGAVRNDGKSKDGETSCADDKSADSTKVNGGGSDGSNMDVDEDEDGNGNGETDDANTEEDRNSQFLVGDLVWAKIKSHPWWPGQVYDPKDASEFALKSKQKGRLLVAFFGDGSWSWCLPSQLVPFVENFAGMSRKSSSRSFLNAVQCAIDEVSRLVELEMACKCVAKEKKDGLARPVVENAGVEGGVLVPEADLNQLSIRKYEPKELHGKLRQFARTISVGNPVDLAVLRSSLSAFYYFKGSYQLTSYEEPLPVEGLEDKDDDVDEVSKDIKVQIDVLIGGPEDDDWHSPTTSGIVNSPSTSGSKVLHKRKRKSVAELMGDNKNTVEKSASSQRKKKTKDGGAEDAGSQGASSIGKTGKRRKFEDTELHKVTDEGCSYAEKNGVTKGPSLGKSKNIKFTDVKITSDEAKEEPETVSTPRERKKSKYLSPPYTNPTWRIGNLSFRASSQVEHDNNTQSGGLATEPTEEQSTPEPVLESADKTTLEKLLSSQSGSPDISADAMRTVKDDKNATASGSDVHASVSQLLLKTRLAAVDPFYLSQEGSLDSVWAFIYALRSSTYVHGPNYKIYQKCKSRGKRKFRSTQAGNDGTQKRVNPPCQNASNELKTEEPSEESKKQAEISAAKSNAKKVDGKSFPCFIMEFATDFPLPSKEDIVKLFGKFGSLSREDIKILTKRHTIEMYFTNHSDAKAAFKSSMSECPFGLENVTCRLLHPPSLKAGRKRARKNHEDDLISDARGIKQKAKMITAILENHQSEFSLQDRSNLKEELKHVLEKVEAISDKVRVIAEKNSPS